MKGMDVIFQSMEEYVIAVKQGLEILLWCDSKAIPPRSELLEGDPSNGAGVITTSSKSVHITMNHTSTPDAFTLRQTLKLEIT
jgi:hypothetical protein